MNQLQLHQQPLMSFRERRKTERQEGGHLLVVTGRGTGKIVDINLDGLSFGCLYPHNFPEIFSLDILDANGLHLKRITVRKTWQKFDESDNLAGEFEMAVGVRFLVLPPIQQALLSHLLIKNHLLEGRSSDIETPP